jgi:very-short-patch-repair endonuclease
VIEADGFIHQLESIQWYDADRTAYLEQLGLKVLRFSNHLILEQTDFVLACIRSHLAEPLRPGEG